MKWYGDINNRLEENRQFCEQIEVGTLCTEYFWSDRHPYEVVAVKDQKHITIRGLDHKKADDEPYSNNWELIQNEGNPTYDLVKRGKYWYTVCTMTVEDLEAFEQESDNDKRINTRLFMAHNDFDADTIREKGKQTRYHKKNISIGVGEYYYDYSF